MRGDSITHRSFGVGRTGALPISGSFAIEHRYLVRSAESPALVPG